MRDNGNTGDGYGGAGQIRPIEHTRTEYQVAPFEGFKPEEVHPRTPPTPAPAEGYTRQLAKPPSWTHRDDLPCTKRVPRGNARDPYDTNNPKQARALCSGCPLSVKKACLADALAEEGDLSERHRYLVRGGLTPRERASQKYTDLQNLGKSDPNHP